MFMIARTETRLLKRAEKLMVLANGSKFMARGSLCPLPRIHTFVTVAEAPPEARAIWSEVAVETVVVEPESHSSEAA
jgi:DeoR family ulaG and ulaABCDEF operon transcriptional repressor